jgi:hypothetical protein
MEGNEDMKKYKAEFWCDNNNITVVDVVGETEKCIMLGGKRPHREAKVAEHHSYHDTAQEAKDAILDVRRKQMELADEHLCDARHRFHLAMDIDISKMGEQ